MHIVPLTESHWDQVRHIYLEGIATSDSTFETEAPDWPLWDQSHLHHSRLVAIVGERVGGWAALTHVSNRCVYGGVAEVSVYVANAERRKGIGRTLLSELIKSSEENGLWTLQSGIMCENKASIELHIACGFRVIGSRDRIGKLHGIWRSTILLERRSEIVGCD